MNTRGTTAAAAALLVLAALEAAVGLTTGLASRLDRTGLVDGFLVSNAVLGLLLAVAGWPVAWRRPRNPIGWLLLAAGVGYALSSAGYGILALAEPVGDLAVGWRILATLTNLSWTWAVSLLLPLCLLLFPTGRLLSRRWVWLVPIAITNALLLAAMAVVPEQTLSTQLGVPGYPRIPGAAPAAWVGTLNVALSAVIYGAGVVSLVLRYRRGDERTRRQLLWLVLAAVIMVGTFSVSQLLGIESLASIYVIALVPLAIMVGIVRHQLFDIRLVVSRSLLYLVLSALVVGAYVGLVTMLGTLLGDTISVASSALATLLIAAVFHPVRRRLQRRLDWLFYGARRDPVRAMTEVGARLGDLGPNSTGLQGVLEAIGQVMRLPYASIQADGMGIATYGDPGEHSAGVPLRQGADTVGELVVGLRAGETRLDAADESLIALLSAPVAVAVRATVLAEELRQARGAGVVAREEERRRLRRDLHDGLGPALTGVMLTARQARGLVDDDPRQAVELLTQLGTAVAEAIDDIRRLVSGLRPPALDGLGGLAGALRDRAQTLSHHPDGAPLLVRVDADALPDNLPAAAEVAAYRIATEAMTNVARHSNASAATVRVRAEPTSLTITIDDNGGSQDTWRPGVGLRSMNERASELGGRLVAGPGPHGGQVSVSIPLGGGR